MAFWEDDDRDVILPDQLKHHARLADRATLRHGDDDQVIGIDRLAVLVIRGLDTEGEPGTGFSHEQKRVLSPDDQEIFPERDGYLAREGCPRVITLRLL